jgi:hypothetical protein
MEQVKKFLDPRGIKITGNYVNVHTMLNLFCETHNHNFSDCSKNILRWKEKNGCDICENESKRKKILSLIPNHIGIQPGIIDNKHIRLYCKIHNNEFPRTLSSLSIRQNNNSKWRDETACLSCYKESKEKQISNILPEHIELRDKYIDNVTKIDLFCKKHEEHFKRNAPTLFKKKTRIGCDQCHIELTQISNSKNALNNKDPEYSKKNRILSCLKHQILSKREEWKYMQKYKKSSHGKNITKDKYSMMDIDNEWLLKKLNELDWCCEYSKEKFDMEKKWMNPSIEREDSNKGYTKENSTIILAIVNMGKNALSFPEFKSGLNMLFNPDLININKFNEKYDHEPKKNQKIISQKPKKEIPISMRWEEAMIFYLFKEQNKIPIKNINDEIIKKYGEIIKGKNFDWAINSLIKKDCILKKDEFYEIIKKEDYNKGKKKKCSKCKNEYSIYTFARRTRNDDKNSKALSIYFGDKHFKNQHIAMCKMCCIECTNTSRDKTPEKMILNRINSNINTSKHKEKEGDITKENVEKIITKNCLIFNVPLIYKRIGGEGIKCIEKMFQASPDRIDSKCKYDLHNTQIICAFANFAKRDYNITNNEIRNIFKKCYNNLVTDK